MKPPAATALTLLGALLGSAAAPPSPPPVTAPYPSRPPTPAPPPDVEAWVRKRAVPLPPAGAPVSPAEAAMIDRLVSGARVIAFGEPGHGNHEPLAYRNRLVRYLVEHQGLTAVALETGIAETRRLADYAAGGPGDPVDLVRRYASWNFTYPANVELLTWLRAWNADTRHNPVRLYGIDTSGGYGEARMDRARFALDDVLAYFERTVPDASKEVRARLAPFSSRFSDRAYAGYPPEERARLTDALAAAEGLFAAERPAMIAASSPAAFAIAEREALDCRTLEQMFRVWPGDEVKPRPAPGDFEVVRLRDRAMADHLTWVLDQEGPRGRVMLFQADGHVRATSFDNWPGRGPTVPVLSTGQYLRARLGPAYRVLMTTSGLGKGASDPGLGTVTRTLAAAGASRLLLDVHAAQPASWWSGRQSLSEHNGPGYDVVVPGDTFDGLFYADRLTPEPPLPPAPG